MDNRSYLDVVTSHTTTPYNNLANLDTLYNNLVNLDTKSVVKF